jgi:hypothetical protein
LVHARRVFKTETVLLTRTLAPRRRVVAVVALAACSAAAQEPLSCIESGGAGEYHVTCDHHLATDCMFATGETCMAERLTTAEGGKFIFAAGAVTEGPPGSHVRDNLGSSAAALRACNNLVRERNGLCALFCLQRDLNGEQRYALSK